MRVLSCLFGGVAKVRKRDAEAVAQAIVAHYQQRRIRGEFRVDDKLFLEVCQVLPEKAAMEIVSRFRKRRARGDVRAEYKLGVEICVALCDADAFAESNPSMTT